MISPDYLWQEFVEWSELIVWACIGFALLVSIIVAVLWAAWHIFWWVMIGAA